MIIMNKKSVLSLLSFFSVLPFVSAQYGGYGSAGNFFETGMKDIIDGIVGFARPVFEIIIGDYSGSEFFFAKVALLILLFVIIFTILRRVPLFEERRQKPVAFIVAVIVSVLAVRFISENQLILGVLLPYGVLGVALTTVLPFLLFFYLVHAMGAGYVARRALWVFFIIVFGLLWASRYAELPVISNQIYMWTFIVMVAALIFDKGIHRYFGMHEINKFLRKSNQKTAADLQAEYQRIAGVNTKSAEKRREQIRKDLEDLGESLP